MTEWLKTKTGAIETREICQGGCHRWFDPAELRATSVDYRPLRRMCPGCRAAQGVIDAAEAEVSAAYPPIPVPPVLCWCKAGRSARTLARHIGANIMRYSSAERYVLSELKRLSEAPSDNPGNPLSYGIRRCDSCGRWRTCAEADTVCLECREEQEWINTVQPVRERYRYSAAYIYTSVLCVSLLLLLVLIGLVSCGKGGH